MGFGMADHFSDENKNKPQKSIEIFTCVKNLPFFIQILKMAEQSTEMEIDDTDFFLNGESSNGKGKSEESRQTSSVQDGERYY